MRLYRVPDTQEDRETIRRGQGTVDSVHRASWRAIAAVGGERLLWLFVAWSVAVALRGAFERL